jgi:hypothetical protein
VDHSQSGKQARREDFILLAKLHELSSIDHLPPDPAASRVDELLRRPFEPNATFVQHRHARAEIRHVFDDVRRQDHDDALTDLGEQIQKAVALLRIETSGRLVDDDQLRIPDQRLRDAEPLAHAAGKPGEHLLANAPQVGSMKERFDRGLAM